jgi:hypothetical protein
VKNREINLMGQLKRIFKGEKKENHENEDF